MSIGNRTKFEVGVLNANGCTYCGAKRGEWCTIPSGKPAAFMHANRYADAGLPGFQRQTPRQAPVGRCVTGMGWPA